MLLNYVFQKALPFILGVTISTSSQCGLLPYNPDSPPADFVGAVKTEWLDPVELGYGHGKHDRDMKLLEKFTFIDSRGCEWTSPEKFVIDGATIPKFLWKIAGSPYVTDFRRASVVHDYFVKEEFRDQHKQTHQAVDHMLYEAMRADDLPEWKAKLIAGFVHTFNKWPDPN